MDYSLISDSNANAKSNPSLSSSNSSPSSSRSILLLSFWQKSPIISLLGLAEELATRGFLVNYCTTQCDEKLILPSIEAIENSPEAKSNGGKICWINGGPEPGTDEEYGYAQEIEMLFHGEAEYSKSVYQYIIKYFNSTTEDRKPPQLILYDPLNFLGEALGKYWNIDSIQVAPHKPELIFFGSESHRYHPMIISGFASKSMNVFNSFQNALMIRVSRYILPIVKGKFQNSARKSIGLESRWTESNNPYGKTRMTIIGAFMGFEQPREFSPLVQVVGPLLPRSHRPIAEELKNFLDNAERPVVYISIGTNSDWNADAANAVAVSMIDLAVKEKRFFFLWSIKAAHKALISQEYLNQLEAADSVKIVPFVEQLSVLAHPKTGLFISHCGLSSLSESLYYGVPVLACPMMLKSDQPTNAARVQELGIGLWLDRRSKELSPNSVKSAINGMMENPNFQSTAKRFSRLIRLSNGRKRAADLIEMGMPENKYMEFIQPTEKSNFFIYVTLLFSIAIATAAIVYSKHKYF